MKSRLLIKKICDEIFREGDNGEVVFDEGSFGESVANDNTAFLSSEGGGLRLVSSSIIEAKSSIVSSVIFSVSSNKGSNSYLGKTADLIIRQTSKLHDYIRDNPNAAKYMLYAPIAMRGMIGAIAGASGGPLTSIGGATSAVLSQQAYSYVIEQALGKKLSELNDYVVNKVANFIRDNFDSSLSNTQAEALSAAIIIGSMSARSIRKDTRAFVSALGRIKTSGVKVDIVRNSAFFFRGSDGSDGDVGGKHLVVKRNSIYKNNFDKDNATYKDSPYHHINSTSVIKSRAPKNPDTQEILRNNSVSLGANTDRRIGVDKLNNEIIIFDKTIGNEYHGHVVSWEKLRDNQKNVLIKSGLVKRNGKIK